MDYLNIDYQLKKVNGYNLKVILKKDNTKGIGLYATKKINKGETIVYYQMTTHRITKYESPTNYVYAFEVYTPSGKASKLLIGDINENSFPKPINNVPFWGPFINEPSLSQIVNAEVDTNLDDNYGTTMKRAKSEMVMVYKIIAIVDINEGDEITIYYGEDYPRNYTINIVND